MYYVFPVNLMPVFGVIAFPVRNFPCYWAYSFWLSVVVVVVVMMMMMMTVIVIITTQLNSVTVY